MTRWPTPWTAALAVGLLAIGLTGLLGGAPSVTTILLPLAAALAVASLGDVIRRNAPVPVAVRRDSRNARIPR